MTRHRRLLFALCFASTIALGHPVKHGSHGLPLGIIKAMEPYEKDYCEQWGDASGSDCHKVFRKNLRWEELSITPKDDTAILVEISNMGFCGSAGCSLLLFVEEADKVFARVLGEVGDIARIKVLTTLTNGHCDLRKTWADGHTTTVYKWDGKQYSPTP